MKRLLKAALMLGLSALSALIAGKADAAPRICRQIEAQLAETGNSNSPLSRRYDRAISQQEGQLARAERQARRMGCGGYDDDPRCFSVDDQMARMEENLDSLYRTKSRLGRSADGGDRRARQRLLAKLKAYGCRDDGASQAAAEPRARDKKAEDKPTLAPQTRPAEATVDAAKFRTLCVRTCDGYFFPMSHAAGSGDFSRDETACQAACPGTEVKLYVHRTPDEESDSMVEAVGGAPYRDLPTAFRFRDLTAAKPATCGCGVPKNYSIIAGEPKPAKTDKTETDRTETAAVPIPPARPNDEAVPDAPPAKVEPPKSEAPKTTSVAQPAAAADGEARKVRVVGPEFLPDPGAAIDLRAPARN